MKAFRCVFLWRNTFCVYVFSILQIQRRKKYLSTIFSGQVQSSFAYVNTIFQKKKYTKKYYLCRHSTGNKKKEYPMTTWCLALCASQMQKYSEGLIDILDRNTSNSGLIKLCSYDYYKIQQGEKIKMVCKD